MRGLRGRQNLRAQPTEGPKQGLRGVCVREEVGWGGVLARQISTQTFSKDCFLVYQLHEDTIESTFQNESLESALLLLLSKSHLALRAHPLDQACL
jgi:hypothetical protein